MKFLRIAYFVLGLTILSSTFSTHAKADLYGATLQAILDAGVQSTMNICPTLSGMYGPHSPYVINSLEISPPPPLFSSPFRLVELCAQKALAIRAITRQLISNHLYPITYFYPNALQNEDIFNPTPSLNPLNMCFVTNYHPNDRSVDQCEVMLYLPSFIRPTSKLPGYNQYRLACAHQPISLFYTPSCPTGTTRTVDYNGTMDYCIPSPVSPISSSSTITK